MLFCHSPTGHRDTPRGSARARLNVNLFTVSILLATTVILSACGAGGSDSQTINSSDNIASASANSTPILGPAEGNSEDNTPSNSTATNTAANSSYSGIEKSDTAAAETSPEIAIDAQTVVSCTDDSSLIRQRSLELINAARNEERLCGDDLFPATHAVAWDSRLAIAAQRHSTDMATHNFFSHTGSDGSVMTQRMTDAAYPWRAAGENVAAGQSTVTQAIEGWLQSPGHCSNLMSTNFADIGVACVADSGSQYQYYWTNTLGMSQ